MSLASATRRAVDDQPFLRDCLRAGICNYAAAARFVDVDGDPDAVATALRRYAEELPPFENDDRSARVRMHRGVEPTDSPADALLWVGDASYDVGSGSQTILVATGGVDANALGYVLRRFAVEEIVVHAAGVANETLVVVVDDADGPSALRLLERALETVPR